MPAISTNAAVASVLAAKQGETLSQIAYAVAAKGQQAAQAQGDAALQLLEAAVPTGKAEGKGANLDSVG